MQLKTVILDLDGVITDTAEFHYRSWQRLADEEGLAFDRRVNERLRGISRRASLEIILAENQRMAGEDQIVDMMARKNGYYMAMLDEIAPANLLPGALDLIGELRAAGIKVALGSASKNARTVLNRLGIADLMDAVADGYSVERTKPAPDLFLAAAEMLGVAPAFCAVVEDAEAGIDAALAAGMWAVGLGPQERVGHAHVRFDSLEGVTIADVLAGLATASWTIAEACFDPDAQQHKETVFTVGNGAFCVRGSLEEGYPGDMPASFMHRLWDFVPLHAEELANLPHWQGVDLWIDGQRFRLDHGQVLSYRRQLDLRTGLLARTVRWRPGPTGPVVELRFERFVSHASQHLAVARVTARVIEGRQLLVRLRTGLDVHTENPLPAGPDEMGLPHWILERQGVSVEQAWINGRTRATGIHLGMAAVVRSQVTAARQAPVTSNALDVDGQPLVERSVLLEKGDALVVDKFVGIVSDLDADDPEQAAIRVVQAAAHDGYDAALAASNAAWASNWEIMDVLVEGDIEAQLAMRFNIFQLVIAAPRFTERASIGAKTLSGFGYRHHVFWDTEIFILPLFSFTQPHLARNMLMYRWHNLPGARAKAQGNGFQGAQFPWESASDGREVTPSWVPHLADPARLVRIWTGDIEIHITADIAYAVMQYWQVTGDDPWMRDHGAQIVLEGAKFFASAARLEDDGKYHFRNVIGPDEYHDRIDDNAFTNWLAKWHLETALELLAWLRRAYPEKHAQLVEDLDLTQPRLALWADVVGCMYLGQDPETGLIEQFDGYYELQEPDFALLRDPGRTRSMQAILGIEGCAETQVIKQPDVLMLQYLLPQAFTQEEVRVNYDYYDPRTDHEHGSSLGPSISAIMACRVGDVEAAYQHFMRAARADLLDVRHNARDGIHAASAGGLWQAVAFGFGGLQLHKDGTWTVQPVLPEHWTRLAFNFTYRGKLEVVDIRPG